MRILIADDEPLARERLASLIRESPEDEVCGLASTGKIALELVEKKRPDVVLLDIRMPDLDGLQVAREMARLEPPPVIIFTTAYEQHALAAFEVHAVDYILKPVRRDRLGDALNRVRVGRNKEYQAHHEGTRRHFCAHSHHGLLLVAVDEVIYLQAELKYVTVRYPAGGALIENSLKSLESEFSERFIRIHRNALVAKSQLSGLVRAADGRMLVMFKTIDDRLEISRRHVAGIKELVRSL